jgi:5-methylcytosine-specific restriction endonuclease McrA
MTEVYRGPPCPSGHDGVRYKSTRQCVECKRASGRKNAEPRGALSDAVRKQSRWIAQFETNYRTVQKTGILKVLGAAYHVTPIQKWLYRMRTRWADHLPERQTRLIALGAGGWWQRTDPPRHQVRSGFQVGTDEHKQHKKGILQEWRTRNGDKIRAQFRSYYRNRPELREKASSARAKRFKDNPGEAAYLTSLRRMREKSQRCDCCTNKDFRIVYLKNAAAGLETDHVISLAIAKVLGLGGKHCVTNLQGLPKSAHQKKTSRDLRELAALKRQKGIAYHNAGWRTLRNVTTRKSVKQRAAGGT